MTLRKGVPRSNYVIRDEGLSRRRETAPRGVGASSRETRSRGNHWLLISFLRLIGALQEGNQLPRVQSAR